MPNWKIWDFECRNCGERAEEMVDGSPDFVVGECPICEVYTHRDRVAVARFARYTGEHSRQDFNPAVHGGSFDTMGQKATPKLPELPGVAEVEAKMASELRSAPEQETQAIHRKYKNQLPSLMDYKTLFSTKEWQETRKEKKAIQKENRAKKARAAAIAKGETTMRDSPLPGDPKQLHKGG